MDEVRVYAVSYFAFNLPKNCYRHAAGWLMAEDEILAERSAREWVYELYSLADGYREHDVDIRALTDAIQHDVPRLLANGGVLA